MSGSPASLGSAGRLTHGPESHDELPRRAIEFIRDQLPVWRADPTRPLEDSEKRLNPHLVVFLDTRARHVLPMVTFQHESPEGHHHAVDLAVHPTESITIGTRSHTIYEPFLAIECKRLPAPSRDREREYVTGNERKKRSGGIQRFKLGLHGNKLEIGVLIGYVQDGDLLQWHERINNWIVELQGKTDAGGCFWNTNDRLGGITHHEKTLVSECESIHQRVDALTDRIRLHHLWLQMHYRG